VVDQLCVFLPVEDWECVFCCGPGAYKGRIAVVYPDDDWHISRKRAEAPTEMMKSFIFENEKSGFAKQQSVIL
jgi:hypothetical protein